MQGMTHGLGKSSATTESHSEQFWGKIAAQQIDSVHDPCVGMSPFAQNRLALTWPPADLLTS
jgi:hypothetical protein